MSGWPSRIIRSLLGPVLVDDYAAENPDTDIPAAAFNTAFHQLAGLNVMLPRAGVVASYSGTLTVIYQSEAWNADGAQVHPVLARSGTGLYTLTFAATYLDELGASVATSIVFARAGAMRVLTSYADRVNAYAWIDGSNPLIVHVSLFDASGSAIDAPFWLEVG
jgi:hypothetical protein